jgi:hypothetical protein
MPSTATPMITSRPSPAHTHRGMPGCDAAVDGMVFAEGTGAAPLVPAADV